MAKVKTDAAEKEAAKAAKAAEKEAAKETAPLPESPVEITLQSVKEKAIELQDSLTNYINQQQKKGKSIDRFAFAKQQIARLLMNNLID